MAKMMFQVQVRRHLKGVDGIFLPQWMKFQILSSGQICTTDGVLSAHRATSAVSAQFSLTSRYGDNVDPMGLFCRSRYGLT